MSFVDKLHRFYRQKLPDLGLSRFKFFSFLRKKFLMSPIKVGDNYMYLNPNDHVISPYILNHRTWEYNETLLAKKIINPGDIVYDCGANIGYFTLLYSKLVGSSGRVFAFEPDPLNFKFLEKNVILNSCENVTLVQKAVSKDSGSIDLYIDDYNRGDHRTYDSDSGLRSIKIESVSFDDHSITYNHTPQFIKMDIQGGEYHAFLGMAKMLDLDSPINLSLEYWPYAMKQQGLKPEKFLDFIKERGFSFYEIDEKAALIPIEVTTVLNKYDFNYGSCTTLFCVRI